MVFALLQNVERVRKGQVTDDIKTQKVEPHGHVERALLGPLGQLPNKHIDIVGDDRLLLVHGRVAEAIGERTAVALVALTSGRGHKTPVRVRSIVAGQLWHLGTGGSDGVHILPPHDAINGQSVGRHAHDVAILGVQSPHLSRKRAFNVALVQIGHACDGADARAWELGQRVEIKPVCGQDDPINGNLSDSTPSVTSVFILTRAKQ